MDAKRRSKSVVGIDLGEHALKLVEVERTASVYQIVRTATAPIPAAVREGPPGAFGEYLTGALRRAGIRASQAVLTVPRHRMILRWLHLPGGTPEEIAQMVRFQAGKDLPLPVEQLRYNYATVGTEPAAAGAPAKIRLLFAAVPMAVADRAAAIADAAGLTLLGALPSMLATWSLARATRPDLIAPEPPPAAEENAGAAAPPAPATALVDVGWGSSEVTVGRGSQILYSRSAPVGLSGLAEALRGGAAPPAAGAPAAAPAGTADPAPLDPLAALRGASRLPPGGAAWMDRFVAEVTRSLRAQQAETGGAEVTGVLLTGGGSCIPTLQGRLADELGVPVTALVPSGGAVLPAAGLAEADPSCAAAAGAAIAALAEDASFLNLLGALTRRRRIAREILVAGGIAAAVLLVAALVTGWVLLAGREAELARREDRLKALKPRVDQVLQLEKQVALASQWGPDRVLLADLLREITSLFPPEAYVTTLNIDEAGTIRINGRSKSNTIMSKLVGSLNGSKAFVNASMGAFTKNNDKGDFKYDYAITVQVRSLVPEKPNGEKAKPKTSAAQAPRSREG
jgi:type IV pilus assembly protein PilM